MALEISRSKDPSAVENDIKMLMQIMQRLEVQVSEARAELWRTME